MRDFGRLDAKMHRAKNTNDYYLSLQKRLAIIERRYDALNNLKQSLKNIGILIANSETQWKDMFIYRLTQGVNDALEIVYPDDGYTISVSLRTLRGKVHIESIINSAIAQSEFKGRISKTQGTLFQQIVSFASFVVIMELLGETTLYVDEAFSGASPMNYNNIDKLVKYYRESKGMNFIFITQNTGMISPDDFTTILEVSRVNNNTTVRCE